MRENAEDARPNVKALPGHASTWEAPRGCRDPDGGWNWNLSNRPAWSFFTDLERFAVISYREVITAIEKGRHDAGLSVRALAEKAALSVSVTSAALTGSSWPRWPTLESLSTAVGYQLEFPSGQPDIINQLLLDVKAVQDEEGTTKRDAAHELGMRPNTLYDLAKYWRAPSSATVFALSVWCQRTIVLSRWRA